MALLGMLAAAIMAHQSAAPVFMLGMDGRIQMGRRTFEAELMPGATQKRIAKGMAYDFIGQRGGILLGDPAPLQLTGSMTISSWVYLRSYAPNGAQGEIFFRGDDRNGLDPYCLVVEADGTVNFAICNEKGEGAGVKAEISLNRWTHVLASLDARTGEMSMWLDGEKVAYTRTSKRPFAALLTQFAAGVGVGNVQNNHGPHNQPLNGMIADLRVYSSVLTPQDVDWSAPGSVR